MIKIFISSTFRDMHNERDALQSVALPIVKASARRYGQTVSFVDLRWGVDTEEGTLSELESSEKVLRRCLQAVEECQPPLVAMLGDRYGWTPGKEDPAKAEVIRRVADEKGMELDATNASITSMEIAYGRKLCREQNITPLVYMRRVSGGEIAETDADASMLLEALKADLKADSDCKVQEYTVVLKGATSQGVEAFAKKLAEDLIAVLEPRWKRLALLSRMERSFLMQRNSLREAGSAFRGRQALVETVLDKLDRGARVLALQGRSGCGKSALCAHLMTLLERQGWDTLPLVGGYSTDIATAADVVRHIVVHLEAVLDDKSLFTEEANKKETTLSTENWHGRMNELCQRYCQMEGKLVILLDGVDQLDDDSDRAALLFLPETLSANLRVVMTATEEVLMRDCHVIHPPLPDRQDVLDIVEGMLYEDMKELPRRICEAIADKALAHDPAVAPLYVSLLLQRLGLMTRKELSGDAAAVKARQLALIEELPTDVGRLVNILFAYATKRLKAPFLHEAVRFMALTDYGLRDADLMALSGQEEQPDARAVEALGRFFHFLRECFTEQDDGRYRFSHALIRRAVLSTLSKEERLVRHQRMADYFVHLPGVDPMCAEAGLHYLLAEDGKGLGRYLMRSAMAYNKAMCERMADHIVRVCLRDEGRRLLRCHREGDQSARYIAGFMMGYGRERFARDAAQQRILLHILQGLYTRMQRSAEPDEGRLCRCAMYIVDACELCDMPREERRYLQVYYAYAAYSYALHQSAKKDLLRHRKQLLACQVRYARCLGKGSLRHDLLLEGARGETGPTDTKLAAARALEEDGNVRLKTVTDLLRKRYEADGKREDLLALIDFYFSYFERQIADQNPMDDNIATALEELKVLVEEADRLPLTKTERLWLQAAYHCAMSGGFIPVAATQEDVAAAHRYTMAAWRRYLFDRTPRSLEALRGALSREEVAISLDTKVTYSLPLLVTALRHGLLDTTGEEEPQGEGLGYLDQVSRRARNLASRMLWYKAIAPLVMRFDRLQAASSKEILEQQGLLEEQVLLYRLGKKPDRALFTALRRAMAVGSTASQRGQAARYATEFLVKHKERRIDNRMDDVETRVGLHTLLTFLHILWDGVDLTAGACPPSVPEDVELAYARWAVLAILGLQELLCYHMPDDEQEELTRQKQALHRYVLEVTARPHKNLHRQAEAMEIRLQLAWLKEDALPWQEAQTLCRELIRQAPSPVTRLKATEQLVDLLWRHMSELTPEQRRRGARVSGDMYYATGLYRYYEKSQHFEPLYFEEHAREGMPIPQPDRQLTREELEVNYQRQRAGQNSYRMRGGMGLIGPNLLGSEGSMRDLDIILMPVDAANVEEAVHALQETALALPDLVCEIRAGAFRGAGALRSLTVPDSVRIIEEGAFTGCDRLEELRLPPTFAYRTPRSLGLPDTVRITYRD